MSTGITREHGILYGYLFFTIGVLYVYFTKDPFTQFVNTWNEYYESATLLPKMDFVPAFSLLDFIGSLFACKIYRMNSHGEKSWFEIFMACILMQFGGTFIIAIILGQPPSWIVSRSAIPGFLLAWWMTFFSPDDFFWKNISSNEFIMFLLGIVNSLSAGHAITSWGMDKVYWNSFHNNVTDLPKSYFLCILCGTLAACGGGILAETLNFFSHSRSFTLRHKSKFFEIGNYNVSATLNRSFWLAVVYYLAISSPEEMGPFAFNFDRITGHSIIALLQLMAYLAKYHLPQLDIYQEFSNFVLDTLYIPTYYTFKSSAPTVEDHEKSD